MILLTVATCVTVTSLAVAVIVVHALKFAKWAIQREDRIYADEQPMMLTSEVYKMKRDTLMTQRKLHVDRYDLLTRSGADTGAKEHETEILRLDDELLKLSRAEVHD